ncbi:hypothetical protein AVEN_267770-1 [Araneus ventricosus]|uniref:Uncharacterized protein n=1 Tax=Araneus ventricosus TaxID=182803 RepID=A0A4Y2MFS1_ARAVE|nr:hypothetical protein AVEN_267770-1 [Araneus ventricosus]
MKKGKRRSAQNRPHYERPMLLWEVRSIIDYATIYQPHYHCCTPRRNENLHTESDSFTFSYSSCPLLGDRTFPGADLSYCDSQKNNDCQETEGKEETQ